jgi:hypothetical protein
MIFWWFVDALLIFGWALLIGAILRLPTRPALLIGWFVLGYANIVLTAEIGGTFFLVGSRAFYLLFHLGMGIAAGGLWWRAGRPPLMPLSRGWPHWRDWWRSVKTYPLLWGLGAGVALAYLVGAVVIVVSPPNTPDAMTYHLSRVGYWLQHRSLYHWSTFDLRQTAFPINYELGLLWITTFVRNDMLVGFVQWAAVPVMMAGVVGLARIMGRTRPEAMFAALLLSTFPGVMLHTLSIKNDLLLGTLLVGALYLLLLGLRDRRRGLLVIAALAVGIAAGVKTTLMMLGPGLAVWALLLGWQYGFGRLVRWGVMCAAAFLLLGSYNYALNWIAYGHPLGTPEFVQEESTSDASSIDLITNMARYTYQAADTSGLPASVHRAKARLARSLFDLLGIPVTSDAAARVQFDLDEQPLMINNRTWLGPVGAVLLLAVIPYTISAVRRRDVIRLGLVLMAWSFFVVLSLTVAWSPFKGRYVVMVAAVLAPLMAAWYRAPLPIRWGTSALALYMVAAAVTMNARAPLTGEDAIWGQTRIFLQSRGGWRATVLRRVDRVVPPDATLALYLGRGDWDYPFFGAHFTRTLIPIYPYPAQIDEAWLVEHHVDYVLVRDILLVSTLPPSLVVRAQEMNFTLYKYTPNAP